MILRARRGGNRDVRPRIACDIHMAVLGYAVDDSDYEGMTE